MKVSVVGGLPYGELRQGSVPGLLYADDTYDMEFGHGVPHDINHAQKNPQGAASGR
jgi:hypothetical protein